MLKIFLDLDGVLFNFNKKVIEDIFHLDYYDPNLRAGAKNFDSIDKFLSDSLGISRNHVYAKITKYGRENKIWEDLEPLPWAEELYRMCKRLGEVSFLTSFGGWPNATIEKFNSIRKWKKPVEELILARKKEMCASSNSILIDDSYKKIGKFIYYGGHTFVFPNQFLLLDKPELIDNVMENIEEKCNLIKHQI